MHRGRKEGKEKVAAVYARAVFGYYHLCAAEFGRRHKIGKLFGYVSVGAVRIKDCAYVVQIYYFGKAATVLAVYRSTHEVVYAVHPEGVKRSDYF